MFSLSGVSKQSMEAEECGSGDCSEEEIVNDTEGEFE